jgi:DNA polymerase III alpha subunit
MPKVISVDYVGRRQTYDLEVDHKDHQFYLANGLLTSNSHAVSYAIDSYYCAWLLHYHEAEWLCAYMETQSNDPKGRARAFGELKSFGYEIVPIDINYASDQWTILDGKKFMPSFNTVKALGAAAACEIVANRPYSNIHELLWDSSGRWKHSKFNKRALENLIRAEAFGSMNIIGTVFESYKHMHKVLIEESSALKHKKGQESLDTIIAKHAGCGEWTRDERVANHIGIIGYVPIDIVVSYATRKMLTDLGVSSIDSTS